MADTDSTPTPTLERTPEIVFEPKSPNSSEILARLNGKPIVIYRPWWQRATAPISVLFIAIMLMVALLFFGLGASSTGHSGNTATTDTNTTSSDNMGNTSTTGDTNTANVPNATQEYGNQPAAYTIDPDGAKHFTFTAQQVMWEVVKGHRVLAWTINGTVPGPRHSPKHPSPSHQVEAF